ncbi:MAG: signal recognition particle-docking protein FtsY [Clostridiales bacterium]|jgi:fused signal recognition particle receptor|nr:signal recognition particle-docking protein FtsY [Clostridiales bacterium]
MLKIFSKMFSRVDDSVFDELEETMIMADCGVRAAEKVTAELRDAVRDEGITEYRRVKEKLKAIIAKSLTNSGETPRGEGLRVSLVIGVNGSGKTTTIGKLAHMYVKMGKQVMLVAADTFRAAATEQLVVWAERAGVPIVKQREGADPASIVFDALSSAQAKGVEELIIDTAGRLHNNQNLMDELAKIYRVIKSAGAGGGVRRTETLLVLDSTTGQNALNQAKSFNEATDITGLVLTKLDSTAKGGIALAIAEELGIPVKFVGVGESTADLMEFDPDWFAEQLV